MTKKRSKIYRADKAVDTESEIIDLTPGTTTKPLSESTDTVTAEPIPLEPIRCFVNTGDKEIRKSTVMTTTDVTREKTIFSDCAVNPNRRDGINTFDTKSFMQNFFGDHSLAKKVTESPKYIPITKKEIEKFANRLAINVMADLGHEPITELIRAHNSIWEEIQYQRMVREGQKTYTAANGKPYNVRYNPESIPKLYALIVDINVKLMKFGYKLPSELPAEISEIPKFELNLIRDNKMFRITDDGAEIEIDPSDEAISTAELERRLNSSDEESSDENSENENSKDKTSKDNIENVEVTYEVQPDIKPMKLFEKED